MQTRALIAATLLLALPFASGTRAQDGPHVPASRAAIAASFSPVVKRAAPAA